MAAAAGTSPTGVRRVMCTNSTVRERVRSSDDAHASQAFSDASHLRALSVLTSAVLVATTGRAQQCPIPRDYWPTEGWRTRASGAGGGLGVSGLRAGAIWGGVAGRVRGRGGPPRLHCRRTVLSRSGLHRTVRAALGDQGRRLHVDGRRDRRGEIHGLDQPISGFVPEYFSGDSIDSRKSRITIRHSLTMTSGLVLDRRTWSRDFELEANWAVAIFHDRWMPPPGEALQLQLRQRASALDHHYARDARTDGRVRERDLFRATRLSAAAAGLVDRCAG